MICKYNRYIILIVVVNLIMLTACTSESIKIYDESFLLPLKIGVLKYNMDTKTGSLIYLQPGDKIITQLGCGYEDMETVNINLHYAYEGGTCTITSQDEDIQMAMRNGAGCLYREYAHEWDTWIYSYKHKINNTGWLAINPLGSERGHFWFDTWDEERKNDKYKEMPVGRECFLTVEGEDFSIGQKTVTAKLRICQLPKEDDSTTKSAFFEIELVEYELSDTYKMMLE